MRMRPLLLVRVVDVETGVELGRDEVKGPIVIREVDGAQPGKEHEQPAGGPPVMLSACPIRVEVSVEATGRKYQQVTTRGPQPLEPRMWPKETGPRELVVEMERVPDPVRALFGELTASPLFMLDVSGSMQHEQRLELLKKVMGLLLGGAYAFESLNIIAYSNTAEPWQDSMVAGTPENVADALEYVRGLEPRAATHMSAAFETAVKVGRGEDGDCDRLYFLTDGEPSDGDPTSIALETARQLKCQIHTIAFAAPNRAFQMLEEVACKTRGVFRAPNYAQLKLCMEAYEDDPRVQIPET